MPAIIDGEPCPSCGGVHTLCLEDHEAAGRQWDYEYTCPATGAAVPFRTVTWNRVVHRCPAGAVPLRTRSK